MHLRIGGQPLLLMAGELAETLDGRLVFHRIDESVLVFTDPAAVDQIPWISSRQRLNEDRPQVRQEFADAVNMTAKQLEDWLATDESEEVGDRSDGSRPATRPAGASSPC